jgi:hypothetical protein
MDILSTLKGEYSRTIILILIPGAVAFIPYFLLLNQYFDFSILKEGSLIYYVLAYIFASLGVGFLLQDLGARIENKMDWTANGKNANRYKGFIKQFTMYLFNKREEEFIFKFELHMIASIVVLWVGMIIDCLLSNSIDWNRTIVFAGLSLTCWVYLVFEAYRGVQVLGYYRRLINRRFRPRIT